MGTKFPHQIAVSPVKFLLALKFPWPERYQQGIVQSGDGIGYLMPEHLRVVVQAIIALGRNPSAVSRGEQSEVDLQRVDVQGTGQRLPGTLRESCAPRERLVKSMQTGGQVNAITHNCAIISSFEAVKPAAQASIALDRVDQHWLARSKNGYAYLEQQLTAFGCSLSVPQCARWLLVYLSLIHI